MWLKRAALLLALIVTPLTANAQKPVLPQAGVVLILDVLDQNAWSAMHHEILGTSPELPKALLITLPARTGGGRTITLLTPKFSATISSTSGTAIVRLVARGLILGDYAQQTLPPFISSFLESMAGADSRNLTLEYGLSALTARLIELRLEER